MNQQVLDFTRAVQIYSIPINRNIAPEEINTNWFLGIIQPMIADFHSALKGINYQTKGTLEQLFRNESAQPGQIVLVNFWKGLLDSSSLPNPHQEGGLLVSENVKFFWENPKIGAPWLCLNAAIASIRSGLLIQTVIGKNQFDGYAKRVEEIFTNPKLGSDITWNMLVFMATALKVPDQWDIKAANAAYWNITQAGHGQPTRNRPGGGGITS